MKKIYNNVASEYEMPQLTPEPRYLKCEAITGEWWYKDMKTGEDLPKYATPIEGLDTVTYNQEKVFNEFVENVIDPIEQCQKLQKEVDKLKKENEFLKLNNPEANIEHFRVVDENKRKIGNLRAENKKLKKTIVIMEKYLELIHDLGYDYDGLNYEHDLKNLIDDMVRFASLGRAYNTTEEIYVDGKGKSFNILGEELKDSDKE